MIKVDTLNSTVLYEESRQPYDAQTGRIQDNRILYDRGDVVVFGTRNRDVSVSDASNQPPQLAAGNAIFDTALEVFDKTVLVCDVMLFTTVSTTASVVLHPVLMDADGYVFNVGIPKTFRGYQGPSAASPLSFGSYSFPTYQASWVIRRAAKVGIHCDMLDVTEVRLWYSLVDGPVDGMIATPLTDPTGIWTTVSSGS